MIYRKEAKTKFNIKGERGRKGSVIIDIHKQYVWGEIQNTYQRIASAEVIIRLTVHVVTSISLFNYVCMALPLLLLEYSATQSHTLRVNPPPFGTQY